jgi:hypothetical protein
VGGPHHQLHRARFPKAHTWEGDTGELEAGMGLATMPWLELVTSHMFKHELCTLITNESNGLNQILKILLNSIQIQSSNLNLSFHSKSVEI